MHRPFPFAALVGQDTLKRALLLNVIQPSLGGVLIRGTKGVAKSTAVRALAALLPPIETVTGCPFQRRPEEVLPDWPLPPNTAVQIRPAPLVELPLGATEDRVLGSLHLEKALRGERAFEPGLLAAANRGILYIDEVNLLPDHLVDILLDAAAGGVHRLEREGLSLSHPARFVLIGTMNPEEGELRPQLLDRFGLVVDVADLTDPEQRAEAVRRRLAFEVDPVAFAAEWQAAEAAEAERVVQARHLLPRVRLPESILQTVSERCLAAGVEGLRADLTMCKAASAWAAYQGRVEVAPADVEVVAELALAHRRTGPPSPPSPENGTKNDDCRTRQEDQRTRPPRTQAEGRGTVPSSAANSSDSSFSISPSSGLFAPRPRPEATLLDRAQVIGRWRKGESERRGPARGQRRQASLTGAELAWAATIRAAALHQGERGRAANDGRLVLHAGDVHIRSRRGPGGCLLFFVVDASGSMAAWQRMRQTKAAVLALLVRAYQHRDQVVLLAFRGRGTELVLPPARGLAAARQALEALPAGGTTPLAHGLASAGRFIRGQQRRQPGRPIWTVLLTDGRTNVALGSGDPWRDALGQAQVLAHFGNAMLVVDTETSWPRFGRAHDLAIALGADCLALEEVLGRPLPDPWRQAI